VPGRQSHEKPSGVAPGRLFLGLKIGYSPIQNRPLSKTEFNGYRRIASLGQDRAGLSSLPAPLNFGPSATSPALGPFLLGKEKPAG
jgi:hypothetical protein